MLTNGITGRSPLGSRGVGMGDEVLRPSRLVEPDGSSEVTRELGATPEGGQGDDAPTRRGSSSALKVQGDEADAWKDLDAMVRRRLFDPSSAALRIGRFLVLEEIGRGGMGVVYSAYDEQLDRKVALKVLRDDEIPGEEERLRLRREAQALARLSHPNVVSVHEVGEDEGTVFVAMEFIRGVSVRDWLRGAPEASQVLDAFVQAGRGLLAAHSEGLVHRDFKPLNMMRSERGVVKVLDFGLARADASQLDESVESSLGLSSSGSAISSELTRQGAVMGTPPYMAPEQHEGAEVDARTDQYSFCVALWEALTGARPFAGKLEALLNAKTEGPPEWPSSAPAVPRAVVDALRRGLAANPAGRWPSMEPLLEVLAQPRGYGRGRWLLGGAAALVLTAVAAGAYQSWATAQAQRCSGAEQQLEGVWDEERRDAVREAIEGTGKPYAPAVWERTARNLDEYTDEWAAMHTEACEATTVRGEQSGSMMDLRMGCLHRAMVDLRAVVGTLEDADDEVVMRAHELLAGLRPVSTCGDTEALSAAVQPPQPEEAEAVEAARRELAKSKSQRSAGRYGAAADAVEAAKAALVEVEYEPIRTEVALESGNVLNLLGDYEASEAALEEALELGARWRQWEQVRDAASLLLVVVGGRQQRVEEGLRYAPLARALAFGDPLAEASMRDRVGALFFAQGKYAEAVAEYRAALATAGEAKGSDHHSVVGVRGNLGNALTMQGKHEEAEVEYRAALAVLEEELGPDHPRVARMRGNLGSSLEAQEEYEEAEAELRAGLAVLKAALGPDHPELGVMHNSLGNVFLDQGEHAKAESEYRAARSVLEAKLGPDHPNIGTVRIGVATVLQRQGKSAEAVAEYRAAQSVLEAALGPDHPRVALVRHNLGTVLAEQGKHAEAEAELRASMLVWEAAEGPDHPEAKRSREKLLDTLRAQGKDAEADLLAPPE